MFIYKGGYRFRYSLFFVFAAILSKCNGCHGFSDGETRICYKLQRMN